MNAIENLPIDAIAVDRKTDVPSVLYLTRYQKYLPEHLIDQLVRFSHSTSDTQLRHFTSDAARFASKDHVHTWLLKGRTIYTLTEPEGQNLHGILWFGQEPIPTGKTIEGLETKEYPFTCATRLYQAARGIGIAHVFKKETFRDFMRGSQYRAQFGKGFWIITSADNTRALTVDGKFGFRIVSQPNEDNKVIAVASFPDIMDEIMQTDEQQ